MFGLLGVVSSGWFGKKFSVDAKTWKYAAPEQSKGR